MCNAFRVYERYSHDAIKPCTVKNNRLQITAASNKAIFKAVRLIKSSATALSIGKLITSSQLNSPKMLSVSAGEPAINKTVKVPGV